jgi:FG-GAP repeat
MLHLLLLACDNPTVGAGPLAPSISVEADSGGDGGAAGDTAPTNPTDTHETGDYGVPDDTAEVSDGLLGSDELDRWLGTGEGTNGGTWVGAADLDGDGRSDAIVGAPGANGDSTAAGVVSIWTTIGSETASITVVGGSDAPLLGRYGFVGGASLLLASAGLTAIHSLPLEPGEVTLDAATALLETVEPIVAATLHEGALLVGTPDLSRDHLGAWVGAVYAIEGVPDGSIDLELAATSRIYGTYGYPGGSSYVGHFFGYALASGDLDGDGVAELAVAAPGTDGTRSGGFVYLFSGPLPEGEVAVADADATIGGESAEQPVGDEVTIPGDLDGDGGLDLVATGAWSRYFGHPAGAVWMFAGSEALKSDGVEDAALRISGEDADDGFGSTCRTCPDVDGDAALDLVVGAPGEDDIENTGGGACLYFGPLGTGTLDPSGANLRIQGVSAGLQLGSSLVGADVDQDGFGDLLLGAPATVGDAGAWLLLGGSELAL